MNPDWLIVIFIISLSLIAYIKQTHKEYIRLILLAAINYKTSNYILNENKTNKTLSDWILFSNYLITSTIFIQQSLNIFSVSLPHFHFFVISSVTILILLIVNILNKGLNIIVSKIFKIEDIGIEYNHNINILNKSLGILLLPVTILISFTVASKLFVIIGIAIFAVWFFLRIFRLIKINLNKHIKILYMFLYLCSFEVIPLLFLIKILQIR
jgi:hypothetical protein